jgi:DNA-binding transcriptional regulator YdaS (Cro superfamily)
MTKHTRIIDEVTTYFGNAHKAAKAIGIAHQQYYQWLDKGFIPFKRGLDIERLTNGVISSADIWEAAAKGVLNKKVEYDN